ncbi:RepB family plasmid replication initiator protein [Helicobacter ailurogastricus]|uniref:RepB family plasmid replication initiator protein n=1 Tax=Helicobacter ailurogastricus TaxID=1578720 RepID=UPI0025526041|nr:RepB family plasmid replication initiator protein [Helicobacter ailurogastricus]
MRTLRDKLDTVIYLEIKHTKDPVKLNQIATQKSKVVQEIATIVIANNWDGDETGGINTSPWAKECLTAMANTLNKLQELLDKTNNQQLKQNIKEDLKEVVNNISIILTSWFNDPTEELPYTMLSLFTAQTQSQQLTKEEALQPQPQKTLQEQPQEPTSQEPKEHLQPLAQQVPQEVPEETPQQKPQKDLVFVGQVPVPIVQESQPQEPTKAPVSYEDINMHNPGQVAYHNDMYKVDMGNLGALESNLLFSIFNIVKQQGDTIVHFDLQGIKTLIGIPNIQNSRVSKIVKEVWNKIKAANFWILLPRRDENHMLFRTFAINYYDDAKTKVKDIEIQVNHPHFTYLLNALRGNFTSFQLQKFLSIKGKYAKSLFRLIERFRDKVVNGFITINTYKNDFKGFCEYMGVPKDYEICHVDNRVLVPACKELAYTQDEIKEHAEKMQLLDQRIYSSITYKKIRTGRGGKVTGIVFEVAPNPKTIAEQEARQNALKARQTKSSVLDALMQDYKENKAYHRHFSKEDVKTLKGLINSTGKLTVDNPKHTFKAVRLVDIYPAKTRKWIAVHFEVLGNDKRDLDMAGHVALNDSHKWQYFEKPKEWIGHFVAVFEDIDQFIKDFKRGGDTDTTQKLVALEAQMPTPQTPQQTPPSTSQQEPPKARTQEVIRTELETLRTYHGQIVDLHTPDHIFKKVLLTDVLHYPTGHIKALFKITAQEQKAMQAELEWTKQCPNFFEDFKKYSKYPPTAELLEKCFTQIFQSLEQFEKMVKIAQFHTDTQKREIQSYHGYIGEFFEDEQPQHNFRKVKLVDTKFSQTSTMVLGLFEIIEGTDKDFYMAEKHKLYIEKFKQNGQEYFTHVFASPQGFINKINLFINPF